MVIAGGCIEIIGWVLELLFGMWTNQEKKDSVYFAKLAYNAIRDCNLDLLKKHPLWDPESPTCDQKKFRELKQYTNQFMLLMATDLGYIEIVKWLCDEVQVDVNQQASGSGLTALHNGCYRNRTEIVKYLIEKKKANLELRETAKQMVMTPLYRAIVNDRLESVQLLLQNGAKIYFGQGLIPWTDEWLNSLSPEMQKIIKKHQKLRKMRLLMKMQHAVHNKTSELEGERLKEYDLVYKHYPKEFIGLTKNIRSKIMQEYIS